MKIAYTFVICDLFHYGHLQLLIAAANLGDKLICGVLTDEAVTKATSPPISNFHERSHVIKALKVVHDILPQTSQDPFENLCLLRKQYPNDEIIFVYGENWGDVPGIGSLNRINITLKQQSFYKKLSNNHIACKFVEKYYPSIASTSLDTFTERFVVEDFDKFSKTKPKFVVSTKANTLQKLKPLLRKSHIEKMYVFTVGDWQAYSDEIAKEITEKFSSRPIVVRSSCLNEDSLLESKAGQYKSLLNIRSDNVGEIHNAVCEVIDSYGAPNVNDQVLVQHFTEEVFISGVLFTRCLKDNAPYFIINYDMGDTTTITSGKDGHLIKIFKHVHQRTLASHWQQLLEAVNEIEHVIPDLPLDIEFAIKQDKTVIIFQVRPLSANVNGPEYDEDKMEALLNNEIKRYHLKYLAHKDFLEHNPLTFSDMAFWNPSELIGSNPSNLAYDLFNLLIMQKAWCQGLAVLGYHEIKPQPLMEKFCQKPYIFVNLAFSALIPKDIPLSLHSRLNSYFVNKLKRYPYLHDKVEFHILFTCYDFTVSTRLLELAAHDFSQQEIASIEQGLIHFTENIIKKSGQYFNQIEQQLSALENQRQNLSALESGGASGGSLEKTIEQLLSSCEELGTTPFASAARMAFIAEALLLSLKESNEINLQEYNLIKQSFYTIASQLTQAANDLASNKISKAEFMAQFGHLRAPTYDITQKRYDEMENMCFEGVELNQHKMIPELLIQKITAFLEKSSLNISYDQFIYFVKTAIEMRELVKFVFTKVVSDILVLLQKVGKIHHFNHEALSYLGVYEILNLKTEHQKYRHLINERKTLSAHYQKIPLPNLITQQEDFMQVVCHPTRPNFVTDLFMEGETTVLLPHSTGSSLAGKIILIESADPGFHWIFSHGIKGLITKYGGAASHMAICCAELGIPAVIGCGDKYNELQTSRAIKMDCMNEMVEKIY